MRNRRKIRYRITAAALISSILGMSMAGSVLAGPPAVAADEALYVNLDHYGNRVDSSVVKGISLNGLRTFTDYGNYKDVTNMSNYAEPVINGDSVSFRRIPRSGFTTSASWTTMRWFFHGILTFPIS